MNRLLLRLIRPLPNRLPRDEFEQLSRGMDWAVFCSLVYRGGLAPLVYDRLRWHSSILPRDIQEWLRVQYYVSLGRNLLLLRDLRELTARLAAEGTPVLVLKGLIFAKLGLGIQARLISDLDLLVHRSDVERVDRIMTVLGYGEVVGWPHRFHRRYMRARHGLPTMVEVHFDLVDPADSVHPDVGGIWDRSAEIELFGRPARAPGLSDHLVLAVMQLVKHHWTPRILADIGHIASLWGHEVDWEGMLARAEAWGMRVPVGSTIHMVGSLLGVEFPPRVKPLIEPQGYWQRVQWHVARQAVEEYLTPAWKANAIRMAPFIVVDRIGDAARWHWRKRKAGVPSAPQDQYETYRWVRRVTAAASSFLSLVVILLKSAAAMSVLRIGNIVQPGSTRG